MTDPHADQIGFGNYLVAFVDLLGQRKALEGQGILPPGRSASEIEAFKQTAIRTVGAILNLQKTSEEILKGFESRNIEHLKDRLPAESHDIIDDLKVGGISTQRWSDGLVHFYCMRGSNTVRDVLAYFDLFTRVGSMALIGLARGQPIRGGIEVSWGVELHKNELYGPAVANAYVLESTIAQYPRIVVGRYAIDYLHYVSQLPGNDVRTRFSRGFAESVLGLTIRDEDGAYCIHFLSEVFRDVANSPHEKLLPAARSFIESQLEEHANCDKLRTRYERLNDYFDQFAPARPG